jgi:hypothetical protein
MSLRRLLGQSTTLALWSFLASTTTINWARITFGQLFVRRFVTFLKRSILRTDIRSKVVKLLDNREIQHTSVDLARFRWDEQNGGETVTSCVTIWVGVLPDGTTGDAAFESSQDILQLLEQHDIHNIDVAYRESVAQPLTGPELLAPVNDLHPLKDVIDWVTTALSLPITGLKTLHMQGTLGFYFQVGDDLYGVTARHVLFPADQGNSSYTYVGTFVSSRR